MICNLTKYLEEQELSCRRMARAANEGTHAQQEWLKTADALLQRRIEHIPVCSKCKQTVKKQA